MSSPCQVVLGILCTWCSLASAFPSNRHRIPNGFRVPCPEGETGCRQGFCWGVGHTSCYGGGSRNAFGLDMEKAGNKWTKELCEKDSDGDGLTNGEELGDPCCLFKAWAIVSDYTANFTVSHPGLKSSAVDTYKRPSCTTTVPKVFTPDLGFFNEGEEQRFADMYIDNMTIPFPGSISDRTHYVDVAFNFPDDSQGMFHAVWADAIIKTPKNLHHYIVRGCHGKWPAHIVGKPLSRKDNTLNCSTDFGGAGGWVPGRKIFEMPPWAGVAIGKNAGIESLSVNVHYDNKDMESGIVARDGLRIAYTPTLRKQQLTYFSTMRISTNPTMFIPPKKSRYYMTRTCEISLTDAAGKEAEGHIFAVSFHAHLLGVEMYAERIRGKDRVTLAEDSVWYFDDQYENIIYNQNLTFKSGDLVETTCIFDSRSRTDPTVIGLETTDEMCWSFFILAEDGLQASCKGGVWTGELDDKEPGLGLQLTHPSDLADGVWDGSALLTGGSLISSKLAPVNFCADNGQMAPYCPQVAAAATAASCDQTFNQMGMNVDLIASFTPLQLCCKHFCANVCPNNALCAKSETTATTRAEGGLQAGGATSKADVWTCSVCSHVYDAAADGGGKPFNELPDTWKCPVCGQPKSAYKLTSAAASKPEVPVTSAPKPKFELLSTTGDPNALAPSNAVNTAVSTSAAAGKVATTVTYRGIDFDKLNDNPTVKKDFVKQIKQTFLQQLPQGYTEANLAVTLTKGSVKARVEITPIANADSAALKTTVMTKKDALVTALLKQANDNSQVKALLEVGVTDITGTASDPVVTQAEGEASGAAASVMSLVICVVGVIAHTSI